jgi:HSP20 family protein
MTIMKSCHRPAYHDIFNAFEKEFRPYYQRHSGYGPAVNIEETGEAFFIEIAAPGYNKDDFNIKLDKGVLSVSVEKEQKEENQDYTRMEFGKGNFTRSFSIPQSVDTEQIKAGYERGILKITLPKKEAEKLIISKQISVN